MHWLICLIMGLMFYIAYAADQSFHKTLNIYQAVALALDQNNLSIKQQQLHAALNDEEVKLAKSYLLPKLNLAFNSYALGGDVAFLRAGSLPNTYTTTSLQFKQSIYDDALWGQYRSIKQKNQASKLQDQARIMDIEQRVIFSYISVIKTQVAVQIAQVALSMSNDGLKIARNRVDAGAAKDSEVYRWELQRANAQSILSGKENDLLNAKIALNNVLDIPLDTSLTLEDLRVRGPTEIARKILSRDHDMTILKHKLMEIALNTLPELRAATQVINAQTSLLSSAKRERFIPKISTHVETGAWSSADPNWQKGTPGVSYSETFTGASIDVYLPLDTDGLASATIDKRSYELKRMQNDKSILRKQIEEEILSALNSVRSSLDQIHYSANAANAAGNNLRLIMSAYEGGAVSIIDALDAQNNATNAKLEHVDATYNFLNDYVDLERSAGMQNMAHFEDNLSLLLALVGNESVVT